MLQRAQDVVVPVVAPALLRAVHLIGSQRIEFLVALPTSPTFASVLVFPHKGILLFNKYITRAYERVQAISFDLGGMRRWRRVALCGNFLEDLIGYVHQRDALAVFMR